MKASRPLAPLCVAVLCAWTSRASADDQDLDGLLNESVVTAASSSAETGRDAPATSTVITGESLRRYGARSIAEAMDMLALGTMSAQSPSGGEMGARGVAIPRSNSNGFLLLINGQRANDPQNGGAGFDRTSGIPLEIVDHIEVILGPGSVLYGSNAMLGVVNVITKDGKAFEGAHVGVEADAFTAIRPWAGYGTTFKLFGLEGSAAAEAEYFHQWGPALYYQPIYGGIDPVTGQPVRYTSAAQGTGVWGGASSSNPSLLDSPSFLGRLRLGKFELGFKAQSALGPGGSAEGDFNSETRTRSRGLLGNLTYESQLTPVVRLKAHVYLNASDNLTNLYVSRNPDCPAVGTTCRINVLGEGTSRGIEATPTFDWLKNGTFVTLVGADATWRTGRSLVNEYNNANGQPVTTSTGLFDRQDIAVAAYAQQTWDPARWFGVNAGARLDYDPRFSPVVSPRLAAHVEPWKGGTLKAIYAEAFRAPSFYEDYFSHPLEPAAPNLQPEHERSVEASIEQRFAAQRVLFGVFATQWTDLIDLYEYTAAEAAAYVQSGQGLVPPTYQYRNLNAVRNWGLNASFEGSMFSRTLEYGVNVTGTIARLTDNDGETAPLEVAPRLFGNAHVAYVLPGNLPTIAFAASAQGPRAVENAFDSGFTPIPYAPAQVVLHGTLTGPIPIVRGLSYRLTGFYSTANREPFLAGPSVAPSSAYTAPSLQPIDRARLTIGLTYEFGK